MRWNLYLLPEASLRHCIEMCRAVGVEPQFFEGKDSECDSEVWSDILDRETLEEAEASAVLEMLEHALSELRKNLGAKKYAAQLVINFGPKNKIQTRDLLNAFQTALIELINSQAERLAHSSDFEGFETLGKWEPDVKITNTFIEFAEVDLANADLWKPERHLGPAQTTRSLRFLLSADIKRNPYGLPKLTRELHESKNYDWQKVADIFQTVFESDTKLGIVFLGE